MPTSLLLHVPEGRSVSLILGDLLSLEDGNGDNGRGKVGGGDEYEAVAVESAVTYFNSSAHACYWS